MQEQEIEDKYITTRILRSQYAEITRIVERSSGFSTQADFIRSAIREKIRRFYA